MNIFYLDHDPEIAASYMIDAHVSKMIVESAQLLATAYSLDQLIDAPKTEKGNPRKHFNPKHGCAIWTRASLDNWMWVLNHATALYKEHLYRKGNLHFCYEFIDWCRDNVPQFDSNELTKPYYAFGKQYPELFEISDEVEAYRKYYILDKQVDNRGKWMMKWTKREIPAWIPNHLRDKINSEV